MIMKICIGILAGLGLYLILADCFRLPNMQTSKAVTNLARLQKEKTSNLDILMTSLAAWIAKRIHMNDFKKMQLEADLHTAQMDISPEMYMANAIVKSLIAAVSAIPLYFAFPIMTPVMLLLTFVMYRINMKKVGKRIAQKRYRIEDELPRLVFKIEKNIGINRDILTIIKSYSQNAGPELRHELEITAADMQSGNYEAAISRLDTRVGSPMMSDVCRGIISIFQGDLSTVYWTSLAMKFSDEQRRRLRREADKIPRKVKKLSMCLLVCFMLIYVVVIMAQIMSSIGVLFG